MIGKERFGKLFEGKPVIRTMYDPARREDEKGFRLPFLHSYDGHVGYHYRLREDT